MTHVGLFGRKRANDEADAPRPDTGADGIPASPPRGTTATGNAVEDVDAWEPETPFSRLRGPFDRTEVTRDDTRVELGSLWLAITPGVQVALQVDESTQTPVGVQLTLGTSGAYLQAYAAPKTEGIWSEIRTEVAQSVVAAGGRAEVVNGPFGKEVRLHQRGGVPLRLLGVDGRHPVPQPEVVLDVPEHLGDRVLGPRAQLGGEDLRVMVQIARPVVPLRERGDTHVEVADLVDQPDELLRVVQAVGMRRPVPQRVPRRVAAEREDVGDADVGVQLDHLAQLSDGVAHRGEMGDRQQIGFPDHPFHHLDGAVAGGPAGPVRDGDERRSELGEHGRRAPETLLGGLVAGRVELH